MTTSLNAVFDLTRDGIIRVAYQLVGVLEAGRQPDANQVVMASDLLNMLLKALQNDGIILHTLEQSVTTLVAGQAQYVMDADTLDIDDRSAYVSSGSGPTRTDLKIEPISRGMYMEMSLKGVQGQPTQFYVEKGPALSVFLYPTPDALWTSVTFPRVRLLRDMDTGSVTPDLPSKYLKAITYLLAADLALHHGLLPKYQALRAQADVEKESAVMDDTERGPITFRPSYGRRFPEEILMAQLLPWLASPGARTSAGAAVSSGFAWFYEVGGGTTQATVYADEDAIEIMTQPVALDAGGRATVYTIEPVRVVIQDATTADVSDLDEANVVRAEAVQVDNQWWTSGYLDGVLTALGESLGGVDGKYQESGGAVPRSIHDKLEEIAISVKDFGAKGDGLAIDTVAIQAAINRVGFLGGGTVYFPPGTYRIDQVLSNGVSGVSFRGANAIIDNTSSINGVFAISGASRFVIEGLYITNIAGTSSGTAISITGGSNIAVQNVRVERHLKSVAFNGSSVAVVDTCFLSDTDDAGARGVQLTDTGTFTLTATYIYGGAAGQCVEVAGTSSAINMMGSRFDVGGILFSAGGTGSDFHIVGNSFSNTAAAFTILTPTRAKGFYQAGNGVDGYDTTLFTGDTATPDLRRGYTFSIIGLTAAGSYTIAAPTPTPHTTTRDLFIDMHFATAAGATTWGMNAIYHTTAGAGPSLVPGEHTMIRFWWNGDLGVWRETSRAVTT